MHQLSKKSREMSEEISEVIKKVKDSMKMPTISFLPRLEVSLSPSTRGYEALKSRTSILDDIMKDLKDDKVYMIGVHGMGGVGKSTLVEEVAWQAEQQSDSYGVVIKAIVTSSVDVKGIQGQLADGLGLTFNKESPQGRAQQLKDKIIKENKVLVIMDDLWKQIDLNEVGVPFGDEYKGCKVLLTSRSLNVLNKEMGTQKNFRLETLSPVESWNLFEKAAGDVVKEHHIQKTAFEVAKACKGLPILLVTVAKALKSQVHLYAWKDAITQLTKYEDVELLFGTNEAVELSYRYLASDQHKSLFLLIGSGGQSYPIEDLFMRVWGLGLFKTVDKLEDARNKLYKLIDDLKASSLVLDVESKYVTMHDVIREGAANIASRDRHLFRRQQGTEFKEWPEMDELRNCKQIILPWCYISPLPACLDCPKLELLVLYSKDYLEVPDDFFFRVRDLKFIDFRHMICTPSLPPSLSLLRKLKALSLKDCMLKDITIVSELIGLEILSLENTGIQQLPKDIRQLIHLRMLNLNNCKELKLIPANLISSLTHLEDLHMWGCDIRWEVEGSEQCNNASLGELRQLNHLKSLYLQIHDTSVIPRDLLIFGKLEKYNLLINDQSIYSHSYAYLIEASRILALNMSSMSSITPLDLGIKMLLNGVENLSLTEVKGARNALSEITGECCFAQLKLLHIQDCVDILYIIDTTKLVPPSHCFICLEILIIFNVKNLEKIWCGQHPEHIFTKLQGIKVDRCERLKNLFSFPMARNLHKLRDIEISKCKFMTNVIVEHEEEEEEFEDNAQINFSKLRSIKLVNLPNLVSFSSKKSTTDIQSGSGITKYSDNLSYPLALFDEKIAMPKLEILELSYINMVKLCDISTPSSFQNLNKLRVQNCAFLKYLFSSLVAKTLVRLEYLDIYKCKMMEQIIVQDEEYLCKEKSEMEPILQNIEYVVILKCPMLKNILPSSSSEQFHNLVKMKICGCSRIVNIMTSSAARSLHKLKTLEIKDCEMIEEIVACEDDSDGGEIVFMRLEYLDFKRLPRLTRFCKENFKFEFPMLQALSMRSCPKMEAFAHMLRSGRPYLSQGYSEFSDFFVDESSLC